MNKLNESFLKKFQLKIGKVWLLIVIIAVLLLVILVGLIFWQFILRSHDDANNTNENDGLIFVHALCRHGDRTLLKLYRNSPWNSEIYWPDGIGQLTNLGKQQQYELGQYFRKRYKTLLGNGDYSPNKIYVRTTGTDRAMTSAQVTLAGLFPPQGDQIWNKHLNWQPVPVHPVPISEDDRVITQKTCNRYDYIMLEYLNSTAYTGVFKKHESLIKQLEQNSGEKLTNLLDIALTYDAFRTEIKSGYRLPFYVPPFELGSDIYDLVLSWYKAHVATTEMKMFRSGYLLKEMLDRFTNKTQSILSPDRVFWMYMAHDSVVAFMMQTLQIFTPHFIPLSSCLLFELYQNENEPYVQIFYKNTTNTNLPVFEIPNCGVKCPLKRFYELYNDVLPKRSYDEECMLRDGESLPPEGNPENRFW